MARPTQRHACDRCHGQKLRCIHTENGPCLRCTRAKATCSWSQTLRSNQPKKQDTLMYDAAFASTQTTNEHVNQNTLPFGVHMSQTSSTPVVDIDLNLLPTQFTTSPAWGPPTSQYPSPASQESENYNMAQSGGDIQTTADWMWPAIANCPIQTTPPVNWQQAFNQEWAMMASQHPVGLADASPRSSVSDTVDAPKTVCFLATIRELSELNVDLYAHGATVPKPPASLAEPISWKNKDFAIDRTFQLSQRLIEIVNKRYPRYLETARMQTPESTSEGNVPEPQIDQGSCLLILSCYTRLIETYHRIFANMQGCLDRSSVTAREDYVNIPTVQVGSFSLPHSSSLQIVLILQLARQLLARMGEIIKAVKPEKQNDHSGITVPEPGTGGLLLSSALTTVTAEEDRLMKRITTLRSTLIALNIL
ncbi:hypothetical protein BDW59DRAFT_23709 [Aspergillus cavernicola]|uniref:Zn(2)-C6 fungal-type domain-containing protein n=1 Tax=Aspergillus cavernicola TaxID=176166 RepID=A0ABR4IRW1_9EURO